MNLNAQQNSMFPKILNGAAFVGLCFFTLLHIASLFLVPLQKPLDLFICLGLILPISFLGFAFPIYEFYKFGFRYSYKKEFWTMVPSSSSLMI